jgi:hypothetical protein
MEGRAYNIDEPTTVAELDILKMTKYLIVVKGKPLPARLTGDVWEYLSV